MLALKTNLTYQSSVPTADLFVERTVCPICASAKLSTLFSAPYTNANVRSFIASHYRHQGIVNYDLLKDVQYTVHECARCALIFQRMIPTIAMLDIVYNQFIDQTKLKRLEWSKLSTRQLSRGWPPAWGFIWADRQRAARHPHARLRLRVWPLRARRSRNGRASLCNRNQSGKNSLCAIDRCHCPSGR